MQHDLFASYSAFRRVGSVGFLVHPEFIDRNESLRRLLLCLRCRGSHVDRSEQESNGDVLEFRFHLAANRPIP